MMEVSRDHSLQFWVFAHAEHVNILYIEKTLIFACLTMVSLSGPGGRKLCGGQKRKERYDRPEATVRASFLPSLEK
jgi:hypothetical protein